MQPASTIWRWYSLREPRSSKFQTQSASPSTNDEPRHKPLLARIRRIKGQVEALERALENSQDCSVVLQQQAAVRGAVNGLMLQVMEGHLREHLADADATDAQRAKDLEMVIAVLRSYAK